MNKIAIGIVLYNSKEDIDACLTRLAQQTFQQFDVILFDNASADGSADWVAKQWSQYRLIRSEKNIGFGSGHNQIIASTQSTYYMPLNPDVILSSTYLERMIAAIECDQDIGWVSGKLYFFKDEHEIGQDNISKQIYTAGHGVTRDGFAFNIGYRQLDSPKFQVQREVFGANGAAPLYRRQMLEQVQYTTDEVFDNAIFLYHEDIDLDYRAQLLGWRCIFTPEAVGYHAQGKSGGVSVREIRYSLTATRYYTVFKYAFFIDLLTYNLPTFIMHVLYMLFTEPARGVATLRYVVERVGHIRYKRRWLSSRRKKARADLHKWYVWSAKESEKSYSYIGRFWRGRIRKQDTVQ